MITDREKSIVPTYEVATNLADLYGISFGGKPKGRYRISPKLMRKLSGRRRLSESYIRELSGELFEIGYVLVDLELYYAVVSIQTFSSYRRLNDFLVEGFSSDEEESEDN